MATAREKRSTLYPEKETRRRSEHFCNRMKVRLQLDAPYFASLCSSFTDIEILYTLFCHLKKRGIYSQQSSILGVPQPDVQTQTQIQIVKVIFR